VGSDFQQLSQGILGEGGVSVGDHHLRAFVGKAEGGRAAYAGSATGDKGNFVLQSTGHG
jgi:hypothetical protein